MEKIKVKILGLSCGHRKDRNTAWLVQYGLKAAEKFGRRISDRVDLETEFIDLWDKEIKPCLNCDERWEIPNGGKPYKGNRPEPRGCIIKNDYLAKELWPKIAEADGFIFGSPVFTLSFSSKFRLLFERFVHGIWQGYFTNKPAAVVAVATMPIGGQESCLADMNNCIRGVEMIPIAWGHGAPGVTGVPYGPLPGDDDGKIVSQKKHRYGNWLAVLGGRRVAEIATMLKMAKQELGDLYNKEFIQLYHPPHGDESWAWDDLDPEDREFMQSLYS